MNTNRMFLMVLGMYCMFSAPLLLCMYTGQTYRFIQKYGLMKKGLGSSDMEPKTSLVPTDHDTMKAFGLCPLFTQQKNFQPDSALIKETEQDLRSQRISEQDIKQQLIGLGSAPGPTYHVFQAGGLNDILFQEKNVGLDVPCVVDLGMANNWNRQLLQLKSLDQFEFAEKTALSPALCGGHALNNACLIRDYAETGEMKYLNSLHNLNGAANFLLNLKINDWINVEVVKKNLGKMSKNHSINIANISAVSTVALFDSQLNTIPEFSLFNPQEFKYVQELKAKLQQGLKKNNFVHVIIIGNEEVAQEHGHYFAFAIVKLYNKIQYIVLDTLPNVYHLQEGSHERDRLMYLIQNIEKGYSTINLANIRAYLLRLLDAFDKPINPQQQ